MKHSSSSTWISVRKSSLVTLFIPAALVAFSLVLVIQGSEIHDAELRFSERSHDVNVLGSMLPASCESGGNNLAGPGHTTACSWTNYCTGPYDSNGNFWQNWRYSNDDSVDYESLGTSCFPDINTAIE